MYQDSRRDQRVEALVEVTHAVLLSLEGLSSSTRSTLRENWALVVSGLRERLGGVVRDGDEDAIYGGPAPEAANALFEPEEPAVAPDAAEPGDRYADDTGYAGRADDADEADEGADLSKSLVEMLYGGAPADEPVTSTPATPPLESAEPEPPPLWARDDAVVRQQQAELEALRGKIRALENENDRLRQRAEELEEAHRGGGTSGGAGGTGNLLPSLGLTNVRVEDDLNEALARQLEALVTYFDKTVRDLEKVFAFRSFQIRVQILRFPDGLRHALESGASIEPYLASLRYAWQALFNGIVPNLKGWCDQLRECLSPETIEVRSRRENVKPWDFYQSLFQRMHFYDNLVGALRLHIKSELKTRQEPVVARGCPPLLIE